MVRRIKEGQSLAVVADGFAISERTARKWLARFEKGGPAGLMYRRGRFAFRGLAMKWRCSRVARLLEHSLSSIVSR